MRPAARPPVATLPSLVTSKLLALSILPQSFPPSKHCTTRITIHSHSKPTTHPTRHPKPPAPLTPRMKHQSSPPAMLDGTGLLQMPPQRAESPDAKQDQDRPPGTASNRITRKSHAADSDNTNHARHQGTAVYTHTTVEAAATHRPRRTLPSPFLKPQLLDLGGIVPDSLP